MSVRKESDKAVNWSAISAGGIFAEHSRQSMLEQQQEMQRQYLALQQQRLMEEQRRQAELLLQQQQLYEQRLAEQQKALQLEEQRKQMEAELLRQQYEEALQRQRLAEQERQLQEQERQLAIQRQQELLRAQQLAIQKQKLEHEQRQREIAEMERQAALKAEAARLQQQLEAQRLEAERRAEEERRAAAEQAERERLAQKQREQAELERLARLQEQLEAEARRKQQEIEQAAVEAQRRAEQHKRALEAAQLEAARLEEEHRRQLAARAEQERQYAAALEKQRQEEEAARLEQERLRQEREAEKERRRREREERERDALRRAMQLHGPRSKQNLSRQEILNQRKMLIAQGLLDPNAPYDLDDGLASSAGAAAAGGGDSIFSKLAALSDDGTAGVDALPAQRPVTAQQLSSSALQSYLPSTRSPPSSPATSAARRADAPLAGFDVVFTTSPARVDDFANLSSSLPVQLPKPFQSSVDNTFLAPEFLDQSKEDLPPRPVESTHEVTMAAGMLMIDAYPVPAANNNPFVDPPSPPQQQPPVSDVLSLARVFNSYQAEDPSELTIAEGETVEVLHKFANGWWVGRNALGATGTFPSNFVEELPASPPADHADMFAPVAAPPTPFSPPSLAASSSSSSSSSSPAASSSSSSLAAVPPGQRTDSSLEILFSNSTAAPKSSAPASDSLAEMLAGLKFADEEQAKRTKVIFEILDSERSYVHGLQTLAQVYMDPLLLSLKTSKPIVKERDLKAIFPHVTVILSHNQIFLKELEERVAQINESAPARLGDLFLRLKDHLHAYSSYVNSYPQANNTLQALMKSNSKLVQFLNQAKTNPACNSWDLPTFLILPIQRVPRYILLVQELLKYTPPDHVDYNDLVAALVSLRDIADLINESKRDAENLPEVLRVYNAVEPRIPNLVEPHRRFVMEGMVYELKKKRLKQRYLFLFNDLLLLTDRKIKREKKATPMSSGTFSSRLVASIPLGNANLDTSSELKGWKFPAEATEMLPNAFILHASKSSYLFFAPMPAKKTEWIASLTKSIQFAAARTKSLGL